MNDAQLAHFVEKNFIRLKRALIEAESTKSYIQDESTAMPDINDRAPKKKSLR